MLGLALSPAVRFAVVAAFMLTIADYVNASDQRPQICTDVHCTCHCHADHPPMLLPLRRLFPLRCICRHPLRYNLLGTRGTIGDDNVWQRVNEIRRTVQPPLMRDIGVQTDREGDVGRDWYTRRELDEQSRRMAQHMEVYERTMASLRRDLYEINNQYNDLYDTYLDQAMWRQTHATAD